MTVSRLINIGRHQVPAVWQRILPEDFLWARAPDERLATCDACYKVVRGDYRSDCQCCTYFPQLPNFMVGLALRDASSRDVVARVIDDGHTLPLGMIASPAKYRMAVEAYSEDLFGMVPDMVCPFARSESLDCAIYPYRNSICSTFFCAYDHGDAGEDYWYRVQTFIGHTEFALSQWALDQVGLPAAGVLERMDTWAGRVADTIDPSTGGWSAELRRHIWSDWHGRELELFDACAELIDSRDHLFEMACEQPFVECLEFDRAVRNWIPEAARDCAPAIADEPGLTTPITTLWYELQLTVRRLWALPFNEGSVVVDASALANLEPPRALSNEEATLLRLFEVPQVLGEKLFARSEFEALEDARGFLAECMRRGVLVER